MLVATASGSMVLNENESFTFSSFEKDSLIIFAPMSKSSPKAIQWSTAVMVLAMLAMLGWGFLFRSGEGTETEDGRSVPMEERIP